MNGVSPRARSEAGVTLVELIVAIAIGGIIMAALSNALIVGFRTTDQTQIRLAESHDTQLVANYFSSDVASTRATDISLAPGAPAPCGSGVTAGGSNVISLPFAPRPDGATPLAVAYRKEAGNLVRYKCPPGGAAQRVVVATNITAAQAVNSTSGSGATEQHTTTLTVTEVVDPNRAVAVGRTFRVTGHPRTPKAAPALPDPPTGTTAPPLPCEVFPLAAGTPASVALVASPAGRLAQDVQVKVFTRGNCSAPLTITFTRGSGGAQTLDLTASSTDSSFEATLGAVPPAGYSWTAGTKTVTVGQAGGGAVLSATFTFTVTPAPAPCVATAPALSPNPVSLQGNSGKLRSDVSVTVTTTGSCSGLGISYSDGNTTLTAPLVANGAGTTWTGTISSDRAPGGGWTAGSRPVTVTGASNAPSTNLKVS